MPTSSLTGGEIARGLGGESRVRWPLRRSSDLFELRYGKALVSSSRRPGRVPVFGTNGQTGTHDEPLFTGPGIIVGRKGAGHLGVHWSDHDYWVIDTAYSLVPSDHVDLKFAFYLVKFVGLNHLKHGTSNPSLTRDAFGAQYFPVPPIDEQRAIADTINAFDQKIESNERQRGLLRKLGAALFAGALANGGVERPLRSVTASIARGVSPKYADEETSAPLALNQRCIRDGWVSLAPARRVHDRSVAPARKASDGDILVNSTGVGTLGRVARWHEGSIFVDSHVSVVKPDVTEIGPTVLAYAMLVRVPDIEALGEGSTGQTELSPSRLAEFKVILPHHNIANSTVLESKLSAIEARAHHLAVENGHLASVRDALLPELLSGRIRVPIKEAA